MRKRAEHKAAQILFGCVFSLISGRDCHRRPNPAGGGRGEVSELIARSGLTRNPIRAVASSLAERGASDGCSLGTLHRARQRWHRDAQAEAGWAILDAVSALTAAIHRSNELITLFAQSVRSQSLHETAHHPPSNSRLGPPPQRGGSWAGPLLQPQAKAPHLRQRPPCAQSPHVHRGCVTKRHTPPISPPPAPVFGEGGRSSVGWGRGHGQSRESKQDPHPALPEDGEG